MNEHVAQTRPARSAAGPFPARRERVEILQVVAIAQPVHRDEHGAVGLLEDITELLAPQGKIDRHRDGAGARDRVLDGDVFRKIREYHGDVIAALYTALDQSGGQRHRPFLNLAVAVGARVGDDQRALREALDRLIERLG
jgi:hypothetical protein